MFKITASQAAAITESAIPTAVHVILTGIYKDIQYAASKGKDSISRREDMIGGPNLYGMVVKELKNEGYSVSYTCNYINISWK